MSALRAPDYGRTDVPLSPNPVQHGVKLVAQLNQRSKRQAGVPTSPQDINHLRKPSSLSVASGHFAFILIPRSAGHFPISTNNALAKPLLLPWWPFRAHSPSRRRYGRNRGAAKPFFPAGVVPIERETSRSLISCLLWFWSEYRLSWLLSPFPGSAWKRHARLEQAGPQTKHRKLRMPV